MGANYSFAPMYVCYTSYVKEKDFINKVHKKLPKEIYRWKINDPYHGGVPDTFYSGPKGFAFIEYKYKQKLPARGSSKITVDLSKQQRLWLQQQYDYNMPVYYVLGSPDHVLVSQNFQKEFFTLNEYLKHAGTFDQFIDKLIDICLQ